MKEFIRGPFKRIYLLAIITIGVLALASCSQDNKRVKTCNTDYETALTSGTCIMQIALEKESEGAALKVCDKIDNGVKDTCRRNVAVRFSDKALCFENENEIETYICLSNLAEKNKDTAICTEIARKKDEDFCYRKVAVATLDSAVCDLIVDNEGFKQTCVESVDFVKNYEPEEGTDVKEAEAS